MNLIEGVVYSFFPPTTTKGGSSCVRVRWLSRAHIFSFIAHLRIQLEWRRNLFTCGIRTRVSGWRFQKRSR